jgi:hypothetical protein
LDIIDINGPFIFTFDKNENIYKVYNYDLEIFCVMDKADSDLLLEEEYKI